MITFQQTKSTGIIPALFALLLFIIAFISCESELPDTTTIEDTDNEVVTKATPAQTAFYHAWLADCTADTAAVAKDSLLGLKALTAYANSNIKGALANKTLQTAFGDYGDSPVWGPALKVTFKKEKISSKGKAVTDNLLVVLKSEDAATNTTTFNIGVAGTNMISYYGWFDEDFDVQSLVYWDSTIEARGLISEGSMTGLDILKTLKDPKTNQTIESFLSDEISKNKEKNYIISVAGHSLGGALAPILALSLREKIKAANCKVQAWPYAGPTPGNSGFASYLVETLDEYHAYNNSLDVIPHAWKLDSMERLCNLYIDFEDKCDSIEYIKVKPKYIWKKDTIWYYKEDTVITYVPFQAGTITTGVVSWLIHKSSTGGSYQIAGTPETFTVGPMPAGLAFCKGIKTARSALEPLYYKHFNKINSSCSNINSEGVTRNVEYFLAYMSELGYQHVEAYKLHFFPNPEVRNAVSTYIHGEDKKDAQATLKRFGLPILDSLITKTADYLVANPQANCSCHSK